MLPKNKLVAVEPVHSGHSERQSSSSLWPTVVLRGGWTWSCVTPRPQLQLQTFKLPAHHPRKKGELAEVGRDSCDYPEPVHSHMTCKVQPPPVTLSTQTWIKQSPVQIKW